MALHPALRAMLDKGAGLPPMHTLPLATLRAGDVARYSFDVPMDAVGAVEDRRIAGPGGDLRLRIYRPPSPSPQPQPVTLFCHGGGFAICGIETHERMCRRLCRGGETIVVAVEYRLAPEHRYPAAADDCLAAARWVAGHAATFGGDAARLAVAGDSAGGNLAAVTALRARDEGGPAIRAQLLFYPVTDHYSVQRPSWEQCASGFGLTRETMMWFWDLYLARPEDGAQPGASPARAAHFAGLPPACIVTAEYDVLRDEGEAYAALLRRDGGAVDLVRRSGMNHGFLNWIGLLEPATETMDAAGAWLRRMLQH